MAGEIVHLELPSRNFERSAAFYGKLFGWRTEGAQSGGHLLFETPRAGEGGAGADDRSAAGPVRGSWILQALAQSPGPLPFVAVDDIDATLAEVERQGGRILVPRLPLAGQGEFGLLADPDGNVIAILSRDGAVASRPPVAATRSSDAGKAAANNATAAGASAATDGGGASARGGTKSAAGRPKDAAKERSAESASKAAPAARAPGAKSAPKPGPTRKR